MFHFIYVIVFTSPLMVNPLLIEELEPLFDKKHCIEASLVSLEPARQSTIVLDKNSDLKTATINLTHITKTDYAKSVTTKINELAQYNEITYAYELLSEEGPPHSKTFTVALSLGDEKYEGSGPSLKKAQQEAASLALQNTYYEHPPIKIKSDEENLTPTVVLNNIATKLGIGVSYFLLNGKEEQALASYGAVNEAYGKAKSSYQKLNQTGSFRIPTEEPQISGPFTVRVKVDDAHFIGSGHTVQAARHDAATKAIKNLEKQVLDKNAVCLNDESLQECKQKKENLKSPITRIYEAGQKRNLPVEFNVISETGKSHQKVFVTQCKLGDFVSEGEGKSKKESKKAAAEKMLENLTLLPEIFDGKEIVNSFTQKKRKKKKKIVKNNAKYLTQSFNNMLTNFWSASEGIPPKSDEVSKPKAGSAKSKLLEVGSRLSIDVQFTDLNQHGGDFYTLLSLGVDPLHVCLGKASTRDKSHQYAALYGLKFLKKSGILDEVATQNKEKSDGTLDDYLENDEIDRWFEDLEKSD